MNHRFRKPGGWKALGDLAQPLCSHMGRLKPKKGERRGRKGPGRAPEGKNMPSQSAPNP